MMNKMNKKKVHKKDEVAELEEQMNNDLPQE